jgi:hypothetical protein
MDVSLDDEIDQIDYILFYFRKDYRSNEQKIVKNVLNLCYSVDKYKDKVPIIKKFYDHIAN